MQNIIVSFSDYMHTNQPTTRAMERSDYENATNLYLYECGLNEELSRVFKIMITTSTSILYLKPVPVTKISSVSGLISSLVIVWSIQMVMEMLGSFKL